MSNPPNEIRHVLMLGPRYPHDHPRFDRIIGTIIGEIPGVEVRRVSLGEGLNTTWGVARSVVSTLRNLLRSRRNVVVAGGLETWLLAVLLRPWHQGPVAFDAAEDYASERPLGMSGRLGPCSRLAVARMIRTLARRSDLIILSRGGLSASYPGCQTVFVPNVTPVTPRTRIAPRRPDEPMRIISPGLHSEERGTPIQADAVDRALRLDPSLKIELLLPGRYLDAVSEAAVRSLRQRWANRLRVEEPGWLPFEETMELVASAHVGLVTFQPWSANLRNPMPNKMFDYWSAGVPVIAPCWAGEVAAFVSEHGGGLLVETEDAEAVCDAMLTLHNNETLRRVLCRQALAAANGPLGFDSVAAELADAIAGVP